jgi:hypothetical protein
MRHIAIILCLAATLFTTSYAYEEGGYAGTIGKGDINCIWSFLQHFPLDKGEQFLYAEKYMFSNRNNEFVDKHDIVMFSGHGKAFQAKVWKDYPREGNTWVDFTSSGSSAHYGYGDRDLEYLVLQSCYTVPSSLETSDPIGPWVKDRGHVADGLHQILGFRSQATMAYDQDITNWFGYWISQIDKSGQGKYYIIDSWLWAVREKGDAKNEAYDKASVIFHKDSYYDCYRRNGQPDPHYASTEYYNIFMY